VQTTQTLNDIFAGTEMKMVSVAENNLRTEFAHLFRQHAFHRGLRSHGHKDGSFDRPMCGHQASRSRLPRLTLNCELTYRIHALKSPYENSLKRRSIAH